MAAPKAPKAWLKELTKALESGKQDRIIEKAGEFIAAAPTLFKESAKGKTKPQVATQKTPSKEEVTATLEACREVAGGEEAMAQAASQAGAGTAAIGGGGWKDVLIPLLMQVVSKLLERWLTPAPGSQDADEDAE